MGHIRTSRLVAFTLVLPLLASAVGPPGGIPLVEAAPATATGNTTVFQSSTPTPTPTPQHATVVGGTGSGGSVFQLPTPSPTPCPTGGVTAVRACGTNGVASDNFGPGFDQPEREP